MPPLKRILFWSVGPSPKEFLFALLVLEIGVLFILCWHSLIGWITGTLSPIFALFLALDAVRVWHVLSLPGRIVTALFILLLGMLTWGVLIMAADALYPARF